jgi:flagellar basal-body rod modification protein FlgD
MTNGISGTGNFFTNSVSSSGSGNDAVGRDQFLKLLTYQLRAQNPMKPYDNQEFATQLAQFSQLEQLTDIRTLLEKQVDTNLILSQTMSNSALPGMLGKTAKAYTNKLSFDGENDVKLGYDLPYNAATGKMTIFDNAGNVVDVVQLEGDKLSKGEHYFEWDGKGLNGDVMPSGDYSFEVEITESGGTGSSADTFIVGKIDAVRFKSEGTFLVISGRELSLDTVTDISTGN